MTTRIVQTLPVLALVLAQACLVPTKRGQFEPEYPQRKSVNDREKTRDAMPFGRKPVVGKEKPNRLLARDGTACVVSEKKYESTLLGRSIWCSWVDLNR